MACGKLCLKLGTMLLFVMNIVILNCGLACLAAGTYYIIVVSGTDWLAAMMTLVGFVLLDHLIEVLMMLGILLVLSGVLGCCSSVHHNKSMLSAYATVVVVIVFLEIILIILALVSRTWAINQFEYVLMGTLNEYVGESDTSAVSVGWNLMQNNGKCCGSSSYQDWADTDWATNGGSSYNVSGVYILRPWPVSCCSNVTIQPDWSKGIFNLSQSEYDTCYNNSPEANYYAMYTNGCYSTVMKEVNAYTLLTAGLGIAVVVFQLIMLCCAVFIVCVQASKSHPKPPPHPRPSNTSSVSSEGAINDIDFSTNL